MTPKKDLLKISQTNLEEDCQGQSQFMFSWGRQLAKAKKKTKEAKNRLKLWEADIGLRIRKNPSEFDVDKLTEKIVESIILCTPSYQKAQKETLDAEYEEDILKAFVESIADRSYQLSNMVTLHGQMYWSKPDTSGGKNDRTSAMAETGRRVKGEK